MPISLAAKGLEFQQTVVVRNVYVKILSKLIFLFKNNPLIKDHEYTTKDLSHAFNMEVPMSKLGL